MQALQAHCRVCNEVFAITDQKNEESNLGIPSRFRVDKNDLQDGLKPHLASYHAARYGQSSELPIPWSVTELRRATKERGGQE